MSVRYLIRQNRRSVFANQDSDKELICDHLKNKFEETMKLNTNPRGYKNLLYFTMSGEDSYLNLLEICLKSINKYSPQPNFDILFITEEKFVEKIKSFSSLSNFNFDFYITTKPVDGVAASMKKLNIFFYKNINDYKNILFLDCDTVCIQNINDIFKSNYDPQYIQVACNPILTSDPDVWKKSSIYFNLDYITQQQTDFIKTQKPIPFNAGQFYFCNSERMQSHFENIIWLTKVWPGEYFFEQSFMNFYFTLNGLCKRQIIDDLLKFVMVGPVPHIIRDLNTTTEKIAPIGNIYKANGKYIYSVPSMKKNRTDPTAPIIDTELKNGKTYVLHFIGMALFGTSKKIFIENFLKENDICL